MYTNMLRDKDFFGLLRKTTYHKIIPNYGAHNQTLDI